MTKFALFLGCAATLALAGCGDSGRRSGGEEDGGGIVLMDSGTDTDSGTTGTDAGGGGTDGGALGMCADPVAPFPTEAAPRCSAATKTCIEGCTDATCLQGCIDADTTEPLMEMGVTIDCGFCLNYTLIQCIDSMGCHEEWAAFNCCAEENCSTAADQNACAMSMCSTELSAVQSCAQTSGCTYTTGPAAVCYADS